MAARGGTPPGHESKLNLDGVVGLLPVRYCELALVYTTRIPAPVHSLFPDFLWTGPVDGGNVYLTFDDGPHPEWTPRVLDRLAERGHKATFFCVGANVERFPQVFDRICNEGHSWGNHTMHHESGWTAGHFQYLRSFVACERMTGSGLFRPPYGRMTRSQAKAIAARSQVVMWDVLTGDFDTRRSAADCLDATRRHLRPGAIAVLHDSDKAAARMMGLLDGLIEFMDDEGWTGSGLPMPGRPLAGKFPQGIAP